MTPIEQLQQMQNDMLQFAEANKIPVAITVIERVDNKNVVTHNSSYGSKREISKCLMAFASDLFD
jgi:hypothetical protein